MKDFRGRVAVITGAASGIGRSLALRSAQEGMKVVLADTEEEAVTRAAGELEAGGARAISFVTDVSKSADLQALADFTLAEYGAVDLVCNNAGVGGRGLILENSLEYWDWILGVNLFGVIYGVKTFVPIMLEQNSDGHVVNTASIAGFKGGPGQGAYKVSKFGVVTLTETLFHELARMKSRIGVSLLCPAFVKTDILNSERNYPAGRDAVVDAGKLSAEEEERVRVFRRDVNKGKPPDEIAKQVFDAIRQRRFYVFYTS